MFRALAILLAAVVGFATPLAAQTKEKVKFGYLADPSHEAVLWALRNGKVKSDTIDVETTPLAIPALIQATAAKTYDVIQTAALAVPRARARGLDLQIIGTGLRYHESGQGAGIWVKKDSPIKTVADLKGKQIAVYSIGSAGITLVRIALASSHGMNVALQGGDVTLVEMPAPAMPAALASGKVDAATLIHAQAWAAEKSGEFRSVAQTAQDNFDKFKLRMVSAVLAGYGEKLSAKPEIYKEFLRVLKASVDYAVANPDEVFAEVGKATQTDPEFFKVWFTRFSTFPVLLSDQDVTAIDLLWEESRKLNILQEKTTAAETLWSGAPRSAK